MEPRRKALANPIVLTPELEKFFWKHVQKAEGDGCWFWKGARRKRGYGSCRGHAAHRVSFAVHYYAPPVDMEVCHTCDNPSCVRPDHLFLGTGKENMTDMANKGRRSPRSKEFTQDDHLRIEIEIVRLLQLGKSRLEIARELHVPVKTVRGLRAQYMWLPVPT
jgi:hypothetical protein